MFHASTGSDDARTVHFRAAAGTRFSLSGPAGTARVEDEESLAHEDPIYVRFLLFRYAELLYRMLCSVGLVRYIHCALKGAGFAGLVHGDKEMTDIVMASPMRQRRCASWWRYIH